jgi:hypothetical protein
MIVLRSTCTRVAQHQAYKQQLTLAGTLAVHTLTLLSLPQVFELGQSHAVLCIDSVAEIVDMLVTAPPVAVATADKDNSIQRCSATGAGAAAADTGTVIPHHWTTHDCDELAAVLGIESCSKAAVIEAARALQATATTATTAATAASNSDTVTAAAADSDGDSDGEDCNDRVGDGLNSSSSSRKESCDSPVATLKADVDAAEQEKLGLAARTVQLSAENTDLQFKLSTTADSLHSTSTQLTEAETKLSAAETTLTTASAELKQQAAVNAALTAANAEYEKKTAEHAKKAALLGEKLCSVRVMLREVLPNEVSNA